MTRDKVKVKNFNSIMAEGMIKAIVLLFFLPFVCSQAASSLTQPINRTVTPGPDANFQERVQDGEVESDGSNMPSPPVMYLMYSVAGLAILSVGVLLIVRAKKQTWHSYQFDGEWDDNSVRQVKGFTTPQEDWQIHTPRPPKESPTDSEGSTATNYNTELDLPQTNGIHILHKLDDSIDSIDSDLSFRVEGARGYEYSEIDPNLTQALAAALSTQRNLRRIDSESEEERECNSSVDLGVEHSDVFIIDRQEANVMLQEKGEGDGSYIIRLDKHRQNKEYLFLSLLYQDIVHHHSVEHCYICNYCDFMASINLYTDNTQRRFLLSWDTTISNIERYDSVLSSA
eukprot:m.37421 g.37421  ORF g.37421 m.37421 type:complete len:342 (-) comp9313_c0_seq2:544-1569(-)